MLKSAGSSVAPLLLLLALLGPAQAQTTTPAAVPPVPALGTDPPTVDPANALRGPALLKALREGGSILFMRHAASAGELPACPGQSGLTDVGVAQATAVGAAIRALKIPVGPLQASQTCRAFDTATLLGLGPVQVNPQLNQARRDSPTDYDIRFAYLRQVVPPGSNVMLVSHIQGGRIPQESLMPEFAEVVVYRWPGAGQATPIARILPTQWQELLDASAAAR